MKKRLVSAFVAAAALFGLAPTVGAEDISAKAAIVYEPRSGTVLYEKAADEQMLIASTTKIMTALVVLENCGLEEKVYVTASHAAVEGSTMYLRAGGDYTVEELLYGLMLASGNDAAAALAEHTAGSMEAFAEMMNAKCREIGLENSHFVNSHGLDAEEHYSSARDLALITAEAMKNESFREIFSTKTYSAKGLSYTNHNKLLNICPGCIGGKTGYTEKAGRILVSCVEREGMRLICVTISDPRDWDDHMALYDKCFGEYEYIPVLSERQTTLPVISGSSPRVGLSAEVEGVVVPKDSDTRVRVVLPRFVFAPVMLGDSAGYAEVLENGQCLRRIDICYTGTVLVDESLRLSTWEKFKRAWYMANSYGVYYPSF